MSYTRLTFPYKFVPFTVSIPETAAGSGAAVDISVTTPTGYSVAGVIAWDTGGYNLFPIWGELYYSTPRVRYWNGRTSPCGNAAAGFVVYKKN